MEMFEFIHIKEDIIDNVYNRYILGYSVEEISIKLKLDFDTVNDIIDIKNTIE